MNPVDKYIDTHFLTKNFKESVLEYLIKENGVKPNIDVFNFSKIEFVNHYVLVEDFFGINILSKVMKYDTIHRTSIAIDYSDDIKGMVENIYPEFVQIMISLGKIDAETNPFFCDLTDEQMNKVHIDRLIVADLYRKDLRFYTYLVKHQDMMTLENIERMKYFRYDQYISEIAWYKLETGCKDTDEYIDKFIDTKNWNNKIYSVFYRNKIPDLNKFDFTKIKAETCQKAFQCFGVSFFDKFIEVDIKKAFLFLGEDFFCTHSEDIKKRLLDEGLVKKDNPFIFDLSIEEMSKMTDLTKVIKADIYKKTRKYFDFILSTSKVPIGEEVLAKLHELNYFSILKIDETSDEYKQFVTGEKVLSPLEIYYNERIKSSKFDAPLLVIQIIYKANPTMRVENLIENTSVVWHKEFYDLFDEETKKKLYENNNYAPDNIRRDQHAEYYRGIMVNNMKNGLITLFEKGRVVCNGISLKNFKETGYINYLIEKGVSPKNICDFLGFTNIYDDDELLNDVIKHFLKN